MRVQRVDEEGGGGMEGIGGECNENSSSSQHFTDSKFHVKIYLRETLEIHTE